MPIVRPKEAGRYGNFTAVLVLAHERGRVVHFNLTDHPTAEWTAAQLMQAFPGDTAPRHLLRDRDRIYGDAIRTQAADMAISEVVTAPRFPWQSPYVERLIGSIRRERLDHLAVANEGHHGVCRRPRSAPAPPPESGIAPRRHRTPRSAPCLSRPKGRCFSDSNPRKIQQLTDVTVSSPHGPPQSGSLNLHPR
jgi:hypothetical protein